MAAALKGSTLDLLSCGVALWHRSTQTRHTERLPFITSFSFSQKQLSNMMEEHHAEHEHSHDHPKRQTAWAWKGWDSRCAIKEKVFRTNNLGENAFITVQRGNIPIIITCPHGMMSHFQLFPTFGCYSNTNGN